MDETAQNLKAGAAPVKGGVVPYLQIDGAVAAAELYGRALDAQTVALIPPDDKGRTMHVHLYINGSSVMMSDPYPECGHALEKAQGYSLVLQVTDIDAWWVRARAAGFEEVMPVQEMFWGARYGQLRDRFGVLWAMNQPIGG
ncbi:glyoxalase/bleomycin resistance/extradiol dioxygenase family protein [Xanthobacter sp. KR7-225]|uniref:VOC family protein n=1 Tax=Xanthobacter sp. KR7-225 TaxID=3156613 RepID=UPI0032B58FAD